ncbi:Transcriptional regulator, MarR family [Alteracholeplasma palmae J233]|uniref:Transcriptional regulator, MarR family n=1 Tax=Alteracholeplasma palmae (strain ATCC 49389 / J233) TaxID=1318466 RepID=U4KKR0_ALTPJ|nr:MarR family transcriptional regulator [Alteracholeplasma palmae]CCV64369.1 Transcriptional regulator, MarR family [Alteracholeplasma palmae J233]
MPSHLITVLFKATKKLEEKIKEDTMQHGLNLSEFGVLEALYTKERLYVNELCQKILVPNSSMTYTLDKLTKLNLIERKRDEVDKRSYKVQLTIEGHRKMKEILKEHYIFLDTLTETLTKDEQENLRELLKKIGYANEL